MNVADKPSPRSGFSLVEIMVVVVIISILVGVVAVNVINAPDEAAQVTTRSQIKEVETALKLYKFKCKALPTTAQGLAALVTKPTTPPVPENYPSESFLPNLPLDGWNREFIYLSPAKDGRAYEIISYGADGEPGGEEADADISSRDR